MADQEKLINAFVEATALGDALGATTEFLGFSEAADAMALGRPKGYPLKPVGGGWLNLGPGETTDDTAMTVMLVRGLGDGTDIDIAGLAEMFHRWVKSGPPDVGSTIRAVVSAPGFTSDPLAVSRAYFKHYPKKCGNGALMRNAVCAAAAPDLQHAFRISLLQGAVTHYHPLSVLCCAMQVWLMRETFEERWPFGWHDDWVEAWHGAWTKWILAETDERVREWLNVVEETGSLDDAMETICDADFDPDAFKPFEMDLSAIQGWALVSLQIGVWAMQWCQRTAKKHPFPLTPGLEPFADVFSSRRHKVIGWFPLLGHDSDTYGAIAGPMIASGVGRPFPASMMRGVRVPSVESLIP